jgi:hypothetical protein
MPQSPETPSFLAAVKRIEALTHWKTRTASSSGWSLN